MDASASELKRARRLLIQVKVAPSHKDAFETQYAAATGARPHGQALIVEKRRDGKKINCEIWFDSEAMVATNLKALGYSVSEFQRGEFNHLVDSEPLFWKLVRNGFRIGENQTDSRTAPQIATQPAAEPQPAAASPAPMLVFK